MHTTAATESAIKRYGGAVQPSTQEDQARQQQRGDGHAGDRIARRADFAGQTRRNRDEEESEEHDQHRGGQIDQQSVTVEHRGQATSRRRSADRRPRKTQMATTSTSEPKKTAASGKSRSVRRTSPPCRQSILRMSRKPGDDRRDDQRHRAAEADDAAGRHRAGADVTHVGLADRRRRPSSAISVVAGSERLGQPFAEEADQRARARTPARMPPATMMQEILVPMM